MMKPISAEDFKKFGAIVDKSRAKILGMAVLFIAFFLGSFGSILATNPSVLDTDPSTYVIVVMLMTFFLIAVSLKEKVNFEYKKINLIYGALIFFFYIMFLSYFRTQLSFVFQSYRIDALLFPILLLTFITIIFGTDGVKKLRHIPIYALFASPVVLLPILSANAWFANINASLVYNILLLLGIPVVKAGLVITAPSAASITISTTCVSLGTFIALIMFLIPVAYLYNGDKRKKLAWLLSGFLLALFLNVLRMLSIAFLWAEYGLNSAVNVFHIFAGQFIFYFVIIVMILIAGKYEMSLRKIPKGAIKELKESITAKYGRLVTPMLVCLIFGVMVLFFSLQYAGAIYAPAIFFNQNSSANLVSNFSLTLKTLQYANTNILQLGKMGNSLLFSLFKNSTDRNDTVYVVANVYPQLMSGQFLSSFDSVSNVHSFILKNGITVTSAVAKSNNYTFLVNYFALPYNISGTGETVDYQLFIQLDADEVPIPSCSILNYTTIGLQNYIESIIYNTLRLNLNYSNQGVLCESYLIANSAH